MEIQNKTEIKNFNNNTLVNKKMLIHITQNKQLLMFIFSKIAYLELIKNLENEIYNDIYNSDSQNIFNEEKNHLKEYKTIKINYNNQLLYFTSDIENLKKNITCDLNNKNYIYNSVSNILNKIPPENIIMKDYSTESNFNEYFEFIGYYNDNNILINFIINLFFCLEQNKFIFKFLAYDTFEVIHLLKNYFYIILTHFLCLLRIRVISQTNGLIGQIAINNR